jgi:hypothetical protein
VSFLLDTTRFKAEGSEPVIGFEQPAHGDFVGWNRYLTLLGERAYLIGGTCDTCAFIFERMGGANRNVSPGKTANALRGGLKRIEDALISTIGEAMPEGKYRVNLLELTPNLVRPGAEEDYFAHEQVDLWGTDRFWDLPHNPKTEYYRTPSVPLGSSRRLFEFVVPMFPKGWLSEKTVCAYVNQLHTGERPTALAVSVLDIRGPATREEGPTLNEHWCMVHYLLDGHHKTYAAFLAVKSITVLSFLTTAQSVATEENVDRVLEVLTTQESTS